MRIVVKEPFSVNGIIYKKGQELPEINKSLLIKLNERGYIEPLTAKQIENYGKINKPKIINKKTKKEE